MMWIKITKDIEIAVTPRHHVTYFAGATLQVPRHVADAILAQSAGVKTKPEGKGNG